MAEMRDLSRVFLILIGASALVHASAQAGSNDSALRLSEITRLAAQEQWEPAAQRIAEYRRSHPNSSAGAILQAEILLHIGLLTDANDVLQNVLNIHPRSVPALMAYAELSQKLGDKTTAEELFLRCTRYSPKAALPWKHLGDFYLSDSRKEALSAFHHALTLAPQDATALAGLAEARHQQGDDGGAMRDFQQAVRRNETNKAPDARVDFLFGEFLLDKTSFSDALRYYQRALDRDPSLTQAQLGRAKCLLHLREWELAERDLKASTDSEEWKIESLNLLVKVYEAQGKTAEAQETASKLGHISAEQSSERTARNQIASSLQRAHSLELQKQFTQSIQAYQQIAQDHPDVVAAWFGLASCQVELGLLNDSEATLRRLSRMHSESASTHALLGKVLLREHNIPDGRSEFMRAEELDPLFVEARIGIAASYMVEQRYPEAIRTLRSAKSMGAGAEASLMLTEALYKNGERDAAVKEINDAIRRYPHNQEALSMRRSLQEQR